MNDVHELLMELIQEDMWINFNVQNLTLIQYVKSVPGVVEHHLCNYLFILESTVCFIVPNGLIITLIGDCKMTKHRRQSTLKWHRCMVRCDYLHTARPLSRHNVEMGILIVQYTIIHAKAVKEEL